jgi:arabinose-5-phosphate isomerase
MKLQLTYIQINDLAIQTIQKEADALSAMINTIKDSSFAKAVEQLYLCKGRVIVSGIGKSAIIAQKIVATFNSTGTPSLYMHAADAIHGDLGMITSEDIVIIISKSGESPEIKALVPLIKNFGNILISITGNVNSYLATNSDFMLNTTVDSEADPNNLAPTTSTTAQLAMGDALAVCLLKLRGFTPSDFAKYHPGGALGKKLYLTVGDVSKKNLTPKVTINTPITEALLEITSGRLGATAIVDEHQNILGILTDGDVRRMIQQSPEWPTLKLEDIINKHPLTIANNELAVNALNLMKANSVSQLIVTQNNKYSGFIHIHDLLQEGII